jgi:hypothetical protein
MHGMARQGQHVLLVNFFHYEKEELSVVAAQVKGSNPD